MHLRQCVTRSGGSIVIPTFYFRFALSFKMTTLLSIFPAIIAVYAQPSHHRTESLYPFLGHRRQSIINSHRKVHRREGSAWNVSFLVIHHFNAICVQVRRNLYKPSPLLNSRRQHCTRHLMQGFILCLLSY